MNRPFPNLLFRLIITFSLPISLVNQASAQNSSPLPGALVEQAPSAPVPGSHASAPLPGPTRHPDQSASAYRELPLTAEDAQTRIEELRNHLQDTNSPGLNEQIVQLGEWLVDMADAHYKLSVTFSKADATKPQADAERLAAHKFSTLKNQLLLLKADLLIKQHRFPEALAPLVDIVVQEPRSLNGQSAYKRLEEIGFSPEPELKPEVPKEPLAAQSTPRPATTATPQPKSTQPRTAPTYNRAKVAAKATVLPEGKAQHLYKLAAKTKKGHSAWLKGSPYGSGSFRAQLSHKTGQGKH